MDFVTGLAVVGGKSVMIVIVDRLTKYCQLGAPMGFTAISVATYFIHVIPKTITSDRDKVFLSRFWKELFAFKNVVGISSRDRWEN